MSHSGNSYVTDSLHSIGNVFRSNDSEKIERLFGKFRDLQLGNNRPFWAVIDHPERRRFEYNLEETDLELGKEDILTLESWAKNSEVHRKEDKESYALGPKRGYISNLEEKELISISYSFWSNILSEITDKKDCFFRMGVQSLRTSS